MTAIVKNIKSMWSVCGLTAEGCAKAIKRECREFAETWAETEAYWREHPELRPEYFHYHM